jgi:lipid II:glycine glycyltransferase (peptidoglycan interpeptide bridge formation enzyme)
MNLDYHIQVSKTVADPQWDAFVADTADGHHVQTSLWATVKASLGWKTVRMIVRNGDGIVAGSQLLIRHFPFLGSVGYVTKGPLCRTEDPRLAKLLIQQLLRMGRAHRCQLLAIQPPDKCHYMSNFLAEQGFRRSSLELAPVASILVDLSPPMEKIFAQIKRQTRQNIKRSIRDGITIHEGSADDLKAFYYLYLGTSKRQKFRPYPMKYYEVMQQVLKPHAHFQILFAVHQNRPVSSVLLIPYKNTVIIKILGWSGLYRELRPNEALFWGAIQWAKTHGYHYLDFEGVDPAGARRALEGHSLTDWTRNTPDQLKYGFGGTITLYPEAYDIVYNPVYRWLYYTLKPQVAKQSILSKVLDFFRKR